MQQSNSVVRIERSNRGHLINENVIKREQRKGAKLNKTKRGGGYKGNFFATNPNKFDTNLMTA